MASRGPKLLPEALKAALVDHLVDMHFVGEEFVASASEFGAQDFNVDARQIRCDDEKRNSIGQALQLVQLRVFQLQFLPIHEANLRPFDSQELTTTAARIFRREQKAISQPMGPT